MSRAPLVLSLVVVAGCSTDGGKTPPPFGVPITGGTITVTKTGHAVISDPDRDRIVTVDLATDKIVAEIPLTAGDEPGRVIEDGAGRLHVALRRGGSLLTLAGPTATEIAARRFVCAEPRGLAWDAAADAVHVACATGELVTFPAAGGEPTRRLRLDRDLRDVIVSGDRLLVTRFRAAEVLTIDATGAVAGRTPLPAVFRFGGGGDLPFLDAPESPPPPGGPGAALASVAWRAIPLADGRVVVSHQRALDTVLDSKQEGGYGGNCDNSPVEAGVSVVLPDGGAVAIGAIARGALPVDIALSPGDAKIALVLAGQRTVTVIDTPVALSRQDMEECKPDEPDDDDDDDDRDMGGDLGAPTSVAFAPSGDLAIFYPEKPGLVVRTAAGGKRLIRLPGETAHDPGRGVFHAQTRIELACASCHPEGREDGRTWFFAQSGTRRTQSLGGGLLQRAPFHWSGDMGTLDVLMDDVFAVRMGGGAATAAQKAALATWLDRIPAPVAGPIADAAAVERGRAIFESRQAGCATCHNGDQLTNNLLVNVGTGGPFKVPSLLGVAARAPFMHTGCAQTLADRFAPGGCGGGDAHGVTSHLTAPELADLITYLESL